MTPTSNDHLAPDSDESKSFTDRLGVFAASACAVHCLAAPIVLAAAPLLGSAWSSPKTHWLFAAISIPTALSLLIRNLRRSSGTTRRRARQLGALAVVGVALIVLGLLAPGASWSQGLGVHAELPGWLSSLGAESLGAESLAAESTCTDECCASVHHGNAGQASLFVPLASLVTMVGGLLLVVAHVSVMRSCKKCVG